MTIQDRVDRFKGQAVWHSQTAAEIGADLKKMVEAAESGGTLPDNYSILASKREFHRTFADDLRWVLTNIEKLSATEAESGWSRKENSETEKDSSADTETAGTSEYDDDQLARPAVPSHFDEATRRRIYVLRAMWDGQPKTGAWVTQAINDRYMESFSATHVGKMMNNMCMRQKILDRATDVGIGYYRISNSYRQSSACP